MSEWVRLAAGDLSVDLAPEIGGAMARFDLHRSGEVIPLMRPAPERFDDVLQAACFPLVPYSNRVHDGLFTFQGRTVTLAPNLPPQRHPLHGVGWRGAWRVAEAGPASAALTFDWPGGEWPWAFEAEQRFTLARDGLHVLLSVTSRADTPMPVGLGLHPFFACPPGTVLDAVVEDVFVVDADLFPTGREPADGRYALREREIGGAGLDNGYGGWSGLAMITWPEPGVTLRLQASTGWFQVYAPESEPVLCAEPVTHANGALNAQPEDQAVLGLTVLEPGETLKLGAWFEVGDV